MEGIIRLTFLDSLPLTPVATTGDTLDTVIKAAGIDQGVTAMVGIYVGGAGNLVYEPLVSGSPARTLAVAEGTTVALRCKRVLNTSTSTLMSILIGDI